MNWDKCLWFYNGTQCKNNIKINSVCNKHKLKKFKSEYVFSCLSGEGYVSPNKIFNNTDIVSFDNIWKYENNNKKVDLEFPRELLFSFEDENRLYGFNIFSLIPNPIILLRKKINEIKLKNPITKNELSNINKIRLKLKIQYLYDFNHPDIKNVDNLDNPFNKILNIIINFENEGFFFDPMWFKNLSNDKIRNIIYETRLIWNVYNPYLDYNLSSIFNLSKLVVFYEHILSIDNINLSNKILIILGGLTYVISDVKKLYPDIVHE